MKEQNIKEQSKAKKIIELDSTLSRFEVPPLQDILVIGREAPIGTKAMERAMEFISKGNYTIISFKDDKVVEAILVKNCILRMVSKKLLINFIEEEIKSGMCAKDMFKLRVEVTIKTKKNYQL